MPLHASKPKPGKKKVAPPAQRPAPSSRDFAMTPLAEQPEDFRGVDGFKILHGQDVERFHSDGSKITENTVTVIKGPFATAKYPRGIFQYSDGYKRGWWRVERAKGIKGSRAKNEETQVKQVVTQEKRAAAKRKKVRRKR